MEVVLSAADSARWGRGEAGGLWSSPHFHILSHIHFPPRQIRRRIPTALQRRLRTAGLSLGSAGGWGEGGSGDTAGIYFRALKVPLVRDQTFVFLEEEENDRKSLFVGRFTQKAVRVSGGDAIRPLALASQRPAFSYRLC